MRDTTRSRIALSAGLIALVGCGQVEAAINPGEQGPLFSSVDENLLPSHMSEMINGRPLVVAVGSAS